MNFLMTVWVALKALRKNKLRSLLTVLGVVIGVCAVITLVNLGSGAQISIQKAISGLGTNLLVIFPGSVTQGGIRTGYGTVTTLIPEDAGAILSECADVQMVTPIVTSAAQVVFQNQNWSTSILGADTDYQLIKNWPLALGEFFTPQDVKAATKVCVLGETVAEKLFVKQNPVGQVIRVKRIPFRVVGVLTPKGQTAFGQDQDDTIIVPYTTAQKRLVGITHINMIMASAVSVEGTAAAQEQIKNLLRHRHKIKKGDDDDFTVRNLADLTAVFSTITGILTLLLGSIASISLLVGGIGIMNIMLATVTERTREIGIRRAIGAKRRDITMQFLVETVVLSIGGGLVGVVVGILVPIIVAQLTTMRTIVTPWSVLLAFGISGAVGIIFGLYPAKAAARLDPIEALRHE